MDNFQKIKIKNQNNEEVNLNVITVLKKPESDERFLVYTFDEKKEDVDIYASVIKEKDGITVLSEIENKEDWQMIQKAIEELSK